MARKRTIDIRQPELTDAMWERLAPLLPEPEASPRGGPKPVPNRSVVGRVAGARSLPQPERL